MIFAAVVSVLSAVVATAGDAAPNAQPPVLKKESFDNDPGWESFNNRIVPKKLTTVTQDFGYSTTNVAGKAKGEIGGRVTRTGKPAYYAAAIAPKTLDEKLSASGTFALTTTSSSTGVFFGWFNADQSEGGGRPVSSLGLHIHGERAGAGLAVRLIGSTNRSCGPFVTPFLPGKFRPVPLRADGTHYAWTLTYDPAANGGNGRFEFTFKTDSAKPEPLAAANLPSDMPESHRQEALRRFPNTTTFTVDVPTELRKSGATFNHFGLMNATKAGAPMTIYFDDLSFEGLEQNFSTDPHWESSGNRVTYQDRDEGGAHDFGLSETSFAGGTPGEVGGVFWRSGVYGYYADRVGPLTFAERLEARGKVVLKAGAPDSDMFFGWFNSANRDKPPTDAGHFLGVHVGGPTRIGHYFLPSLTTAKGTKGKLDSGPVLTPNKVYDWSLVYDPSPNGGDGAVTATLGQESATLRLKKDVKAQGASFDRFGFFTPSVGGQIVRIYFDDLEYTARGK